ncbi:MAG: hypothetical protein L0H96_16545 [Humibacillus sp.]|nr:hypothetical protein [Humibacillus sp.]
MLPSADTSLARWPNLSGLTRPNVSNLNPAAGTIAANVAMVGVGIANDFKACHGSDATAVVINVSGTMEHDRATPAEGCSAPAPCVVSRVATPQQKRPRHEGGGVELCW